jgi:tRNA 2-selenouridine synthase
VSILRLNIKDFLNYSEGHTILDVRSPSEFKQAHIPGAYSLPLFNDDERKEVGTIYKQESREKAIKAGLDIFAPKMRKMVEEVEAVLNNQADNGLGIKDDKQLFIYCWRGGMRSAGVAWLMDLYGFKVQTLAGGYKAFRNEVLSSFEEPYKLKILGGFTGSAKTELLNQLRSAGEKVIDLEQLACHKGSAFGGINMPVPPRQEMFENLLAMELRKSLNSKYIWLEDESQRIGNLNIPGPLWNNMRNSPIVFLDISFEKRLDYITEEYGSCDKEKLKDAVERIKKRLGGLDAKNTLEHFEKGELREGFRILLQYYDKQYLKGLHSRPNLSSLLTRVHCDTIGNENIQILKTNIPIA